jgi:cell division protein FtsW (lipid II flippase)
LMIFRLSPAYGFRQSLWLIVSLVVVVVGLRFRNLIGFLKRFKYLWLFLGLLLTALTFIFGTYPGGIGPGLWLGCCGIYLQPSEFLKILLIIYLAGYLAENASSKFSLAQLITPTLIIVGVSLVILVAQRDLGTASLFLVLYTLIIYLATGKRRFLLVSAISIIVVLIAGYYVFDVIQIRVEAWLNPWQNAQGSSYQIVQSLIAMANGGIFGRGIGLGSPGVIPVAHSDFIYPAIVEEFGLTGALILICILAFFAIRGISIALRAPNSFQRFLAVGLTTLLVSQSILIIGGTIKLLPLTGVTLPFVSYGGTSLLSSFIAITFLLIISNQVQEQTWPLEHPRPFLYVGTFFLTALAAIGIVTAWWSVVQSSDLLSRKDNPRRAISDHYVYRGKILDRNNQILTDSSGLAPEIRRVVHYPPLSSVVGYSDDIYGQTGVESSLDGFLRGVSKNSSLSVAWAKLLMGQYPPGFDVKISIDTELQEKADQVLAGHTGSIILMNAETGEILALATSPTFNANLLSTKWSEWKNEPTAPLINRATQASYAPGTVLGGVILADYLEKFTLPDQVISLESDLSSCAVFPGPSPSWPQAIKAGCIQPISFLGEVITKPKIINFFASAGLFTEPSIALETNPPVSISSITSFNSLLTGQANFLVSPLQVCLAAASLTNGGKLVAPMLEIAYKDSLGEWILFNRPEPITLLTKNAADRAAELLASSSLPIWDNIAVTNHQLATISWYLAGTLPQWAGVPIVEVVAIEEKTQESASTIGRELLSKAFSLKK